MEYEHKDYKKMIFAYLSGSLDGEERAAFERHLAVCPECRKELSEAEELNSFLDGFSPDPPEALKNGVMARIRAEKRQARLKRLWRIALPAAMLTVVIAAAAVYPMMLGNKHSGALLDGASDASDACGSNKDQNIFGSFEETPDDREPEESVPDIFFFFTSEGYLQGSEEADGEPGDSGINDPVLPPAASDSPHERETDTGDIGSAVTLPDCVDSDIIDRFSMQIKLVRSYIFLDSLPDDISEPMLVYEYRGYKVLIFTSDDTALPDSMTELYPDGSFSLVIVG